MSVNIAGGGLSFDASIDDSEFQKNINDIDKSLNSLTIKAQSYKKVIENTQDRVILADFNKKLQQTQSEIERLKSVGKDGFDSLGNKIEQTSKKSGGFLSQLKSIAGFLGIAFGINAVINFGKEMVLLSAKAEGIRTAFARIGDASTLESLRKATRGAVSDIDLMSKALRASDFKIAPELLAKGLDFAGRVSRRTGQDVNYLTESLVNGLGRKSVLILDNLGISASELRAEIKKSGDFSEAVSIVIERKLQSIGDVSLTTADKISKIGAQLENLKTNLGSSTGGVISFLSGTVSDYLEFLNNSVKDTDTKLQELGQKRAKDEGSLNLFKADDSKGRESYLKGVTKNIQLAQDELSKLDDQLKEIGVLKSIGREVFGLPDLQKQRDSSKLYLEQLKAEKGNAENFIKVESDKNKKLEEERQANFEKGKSAREKANREAEKQADDFAIMNQKIFELKSEYYIKSLSKDEAELQSVRDKFKKIADEVKKFNSNPKNKYKVDGAIIEQIRDKAIKDLSYQQDTEKLKASLEQQKKIFADFEAYKKEVGEEKAKERFAKELDFAKATQDNAAKELSGLLAGGNVIGLDGKQQNRLAYLIKSLKDESDLKKQAEISAYTEALNAAKTHTDKLLEIESQYQDRVKAFKGTATDEQLALLKKERDDKFKAENSSNLDNQTNWAEMFSNLEFMSKESVRKYLEDVRKKVDAEYTAGSITESEYRQRIKAIENANDQFVSKTDPAFKLITKDLKDWVDAINAFGKGSDEAGNKFKETAGKVAAAATATNQIISDITGTLESLGVKVDDSTKQTIKNVQGVIGGIGDLAKGIATGNPIDIIKGSVEILTNAIALFNTKDKKLEAKIKDYQERLKQLGESFKDLDRAVRNAVGEDVYKQSEAQIRNLRQQQALLAQSINSESAKKKSDSGKIDEYKNQIKDIDRQIKDLQQSIKENLLQTNFRQFSNDIADALVGAFAAGEDASQALDKTFDKVIQNMVKNALKIKLLEGPVNAVLNQLTNYLETHNNDVTGFDFDAAKKKLQDAGQQFNEAVSGFGDLFKDTTNTSGKSNTLSGAIKGISADQADLLAGQFGGLRLTQLMTNDLLKFQNDIQNQQLLYQRMTANSLTNIESYTQRTANNTDNLFEMKGYLKSIESKIDSASNALKAGGKGP